MSASIWNPNPSVAAAALTQVKYDVFVAAAGQTAFTLVNCVAVPGANNVFVIVDSFFYPFDEFTVNSSTLITLDEALDGGETVLFVALNAVVLSAPLSSEQYTALFAEVQARADAAARAVAIAPSVANSRLEVIAHRGFADQFPQNTLLAMSAALRRGASSLECDVQVSSDGTCILYHDTNLNSLTSGAGVPSTQTLAYIQGLSFTALAGTEFSATRIPTFLDFLKLARSRSIYVYPEIKAYRTQADILLMLADIETASMSDLCMLQSFTYSDLVYVRSVNSAVTIGFLGGSFITDYETYVDSLADLGNAALVWERTDLIARPAIVTYALAAGVDVVAYTINTTEEALAVAAVGVRRIMSDCTLEV